MAYVFFDSSYAPCAFLIVPDNGDPYDDSTTALVQTDWDWPAVASRMGFVPCRQCDSTDGTVDCEHKTASEMISEAYVFIRDREGERFEALDDYLPC